MTEIGDIFSTEAYALGKMLDHSGWHGRLPREITPSDFDMIFDNYGKMLVCELSSSNNRWADLTVGQRGAYQSAIHNGSVHCAVLCRHNVKLDERRKIKTLTDIVAFQAMVYHFQNFRISKVVEGNNNWQNFVSAWYDNPDGLRGTIIERSEIFPASWWF